MNKLLLGSALLALPFAGQASDPFQKLSAYFVNTEIEANGGEDDGSERQGAFEQHHQGWGERWR